MVVSLCANVYAGSVSPDAAKSLQTEFSLDGSGEGVQIEQPESNAMPTQAPDSAVLEETPSSTVPEETPSSTVPEETPDSNVPGETPDSSVPEETPDSSIPEETPDSSVPEETPDSNVPGETPDSSVPEETPDSTETEDSVDGTQDKESDSATLAVNGSGWSSQNFGSYSASVYIDPNGQLLVGPHYIEQGPGGSEGGYFFFYENGALAWTAPIEWNGKVYEALNGRLLTGFVNKNFGSYSADVYYDPNDLGAMAQKKILKIGNELCAFYEDGSRAWAGYLSWDKFYKIENGVVYTGLTNVDFGDYIAAVYFDPNDNGAAAIGIRTVNGQKMFFYENGARAWNDFPQLDGNTYCSQNGCLVTGWVNRDFGSYRANSYFDPATGVMKTGFCTIDGVNYLFMSNGGLQWGENGITVNDDKTYYIVNGVVQTGWINRDFGSYHANSYFDPATGVMKTGVVKIGEWLYFFTPDGAQQWGDAIFDYNGCQYFVRQGKIVTNQTIEVNGVSYRADENGVLTKLSATACIDVSYHQGVINWKAVAESGIQYAIIRAVGWDRVNQTVGGVDTMFDYNVREAKKYGIKVGAYIYTYAVNTAEAQTEINAFVTAMKKLEKDGYRLDLPVFVDQEDNSLLSAMTYQQRTDQLRYQMVLLEQKGYYPGMYMYTVWSQSYVNAEQLYSEGYDMWIADYRTSVQNPVWAGRCAMWQYRSDGRVPGINGNVDMNYLYKDYSGLIQGSNNTGDEVNALFKVRNENANGAVVEDTMLNILAAIVNNEVGNGLTLTGNDRTQLYQAQAVAAHSWLMYNYTNGEAIPSVGLNYSGNYSLIKTQIAAVEDQILTYGGNPILAVYGSCSNGKTNSSGDYWSTDLPYLVAGIESKYDEKMAPQYFPTTSRTRTAAELSAELKAKHGIDTSGYPDPGTWFTINGRNAGGYITSLTICGKTIKAGTLNDNFSPILTTDFEIRYNPQNQTFVFLSYGNGHCVGMSQYGAAGYIKYEGWNYQRILSHYFPNTVISTIES